MKSWVDYWNSDHSIYVSERHKQVHAAAVGRDILRQIPSASAVVLDHGCGEALYAEAVAAGCGRLILCEAAPAVREIWSMSNPPPEQPEPRPGDPRPEDSSELDPFNDQPPIAP